MQKYHQGISVIPTIVAAMIVAKMPLAQSAKSAGSCFITKSITETAPMLSHQRGVALPNVRMLRVAATHGVRGRLMRHGLAGDAGLVQAAGLGQRFSGNVDGELAGGSVQQGGGACGRSGTGFHLKASPFVGVSSGADDLRSAIM